MSQVHGHKWTICKWTQCSLVLPYGILEIWINTRSGNDGLLHGGTKPLADTVLSSLWIVIHASTLGLGFLTLHINKLMQKRSNIIVLMHCSYNTSKKLCTWFTFCCGYMYQLIKSISFRATSLTLGQSYGCPSASELTLKDMGKYTTSIYKDY